MDIKLENGKLTITVTIGPGVPSASGKTLVVAGTGGFVPVPGSELKVSLNVIKSIR